jgi:hypothetical protein
MNPNDLIWLFYLAPRVKKILGVQSKNISLLMVKIYLKNYKTYPRISVTRVCLRRV